MRSDSDRPAATGELLDDGDRAVIDEMIRQYRVEQFLYEEAALLDDFALAEWLDLLAEDASFSAPVSVRHEAMSDLPDHSDETDYLRWDYENIVEQADRLTKEYGWAENPRSRLCHFIGNVRILGANDDTIEVENTQVVYRNYRDRNEYDLLWSTRETTLHETDDRGFRIGDRTVYFKDVVLNTKNITLPVL